MDQVIIGVDPHKLPVTIRPAVQLMRHAAPRTRLARHDCSCAPSSSPASGWGIGTSRSSRTRWLAGSPSVSWMIRARNEIDHPRHMATLRM